MLGSSIAPTKHWTIVDACGWLYYNAHATCKTKGCQLDNNYDNSVITGPITLKLCMHVGTHLAAKVNWDLPCTCARAVWRFQISRTAGPIALKFGTLIGTSRVPWKSIGCTPTQFCMCRAQPLARSFIASKRRLADCIDSTGLPSKKKYILYYNNIPVLDNFEKKTTDRMCHVKASAPISPTGLVQGQKDNQC